MAAALSSTVSFLCANRRIRFASPIPTNLPSDHAMGYLVRKNLQSSSSTSVFHYTQSLNIVGQPLSPRIVTSPSSDKTFSVAAFLRSFGSLPIPNLIVSPNAEEAFKKMVEVDRLIDLLRHATPHELKKIVAENILAFDEGFWMRLAARTDSCKSEDDKKDYEELAVSVMSIVDRLVHKTNEKIESSTDVLKGILKHVVDEKKEIIWPPRDLEALKMMEREVTQLEQDGQLDEGFLSEVNAQLRQAKGDGDKPGLVAMLQKVLQFYASKVLSKRSYAKKGNETLKDELFLELLIKAPEEEWNKLLMEGMTVGKGEVSPKELYSVIKKRIERTLIRTEGGSYQQRILTEYLKGIQSRAEEIVRVLQGSPQ